MRWARSATALEIAMVGTSLLCHRKSFMEFNNQFLSFIDDLAGIHFSPGRMIPSS